MSVLAPWLMCVLTGCASFGGVTMPWQKKADAKNDLPPPSDSLTLTDRGLEREAVDPRLRQELEKGKALFAQKKYSEAEPIFHKLTPAKADRAWWDVAGVFAPSYSDSTFNPIDEDKDKSSRDKEKEKEKKRKIPALVREEAMFLEAECQRLQKNYRAACDTYTQLLVDFPRSQYTQATCKSLFEIADFWLEPTRHQMDAYQEQLAGKRWFVMPALYFHWDNEMPFLDAEGNAMAVLNTIRLHDINGPLGEKALLYLGTVNFYRKDYKEADFYFNQLRKDYPNSKFAPKAIKQAVICKQLSTGGSVYDCRPLQESKELLLIAQASYPELAKDEDWVVKQLKSINIQQADRDWNVAEFYRRTGHPGAAYFYYELVRRRYPGTSYSEKATQKMSEVRAKVDAERSQAGPANSPVTGPGAQLPPTPEVVPPSRTITSAPAPTR